MRRAGVGSVDRRDLVRGGGAIALTGALDALIAVPMSSQAQQPPVSIPVVDRLAVRVLVDSYQIAVAPSFKIDNVQVERFGWPLSDAPPPGERQMFVSAFSSDSTTAAWVRNNVREHIVKSSLFDTCP
jgi:hypothetical protein